MQRSDLEVRLSDPSPQAIPAYVSIRQHTSATISRFVFQTPLLKQFQHTSAYVSIRQHTSATISRFVVRPLSVSTWKFQCEPTMMTSKCACAARNWDSPMWLVSSKKTNLQTSAYVSIRQHTSAYVSIRQHTSAYVSIRQHTSAYPILGAPITLGR
jgi:hypothetical protein